MAGWVRGIREVRHVTVAVDEASVGSKRGPVVTSTRREIEEVKPECWARLVPFGVDLPVPDGAGPCGTFARGLRWCPRFLDPNGFLGQRHVDPYPKPYIKAPRPLAWSIQHLVEPLATWYATYKRPMHFGPKTGPRGRG